MLLQRTVVIGITPAFDEGVKLPASQASLYLRREYARVIGEVGAIPLILSPDMPMEYILAHCDGIVISGGEDIPAEVYGGQELLTVPEPLERVMWERLLIDACEAVGKPVLGVCYGMQLLTLHYGGSLYQDIATEVEASIEHKGVPHDVRLMDDFLGLKKGHSYTVASRHHQAVAMLPDTFALCATAPDGVIEAMAGSRMYGVQWHPESDATGATIYRAFVSVCSGVYKQG